MDYNKTGAKKVNPKLTSNLFSKLFFWYTFSIFKKGFKNDLTSQDIYQVLPEYRSEKLGTKLETEWMKSRHKKNVSLYHLLWKCFGLNYVLLNMTQFINIAISSAASPFLTGLIISYYTPAQSKISKPQVVLYSCILICLHIIRAIYLQNFALAIMGLAIKLRAALASFIYRRILYIRASDINKIEIGRYTTIITNDLTDIEITLNASIYFWSDLLKIFIVVFVLYRRIGIFALFLLGFFIISIPVHYFVIVKIFKVIKQRSAKSDERITLTKRVLSAIRTVKMANWENYFFNLISKSRKIEVKAICRVFELFYINKAIATLFFQLSFYFILTTFIEFGTDVTPGDIFFVISSIQSISFARLTTVPGHLTVFINVIQRIKFIIDENTYDDRFHSYKNDSLEPKLILENVSFRTILSNINLNAEYGLNIISGPVASGKSTLLKLILGHFQATSGKITCNGKISYAAQEPWIFPSTIKQNIIFTEDYNEKRYQEVVKCCGLIHDFNTFEDGDNTIISENGINLSKGQQLRINLARAAYRSADIYLLDDCFSVLDAVVADFVFRECIMGFLSGKIVVLVTHKQNFAKHALKCHDLSLKQHDDTVNCKSSSEDIFENDDDLGENTVLLNNKNDIKMIYDEAKESKQIPLNLYWDYIKYGGGIPTCLFIIAIFATSQTINSYKDKLVSSWSNLEQTMINYTNAANESDSHYLELYNERTRIVYVYAAVILAIISFVLMQAFAIFRIGKMISRKFHKLIARNLLGAHMNFYCSNFLGNILNRLYQDLLLVDRAIPLDIFALLILICELIGSIILVVSVNAIFLIPSTIFFVLLYLLRRFYLRTAINLKRLNCSSRSAMIGYMSSTLNGLATIQVSNAQEILQSEFDQHLNNAISASYTFESCRLAFTCFGDLTSCLFTAAVIFRFLIIDYDTTSGSVGLAITQSFMMSMSIYVGISEWANFDTAMTSFERLLEYTKMKQEVKDGLVLENWPKRGEIEFKRVSMSYGINSNNNYALKDLNFTVKAGEKVGIVGRTGSGKSSIISALFRLYDVDGKILIDGVDIKTLSLEFLREQIAVIPQDPFVFPGSIRDNIDPLRRFSDEKIWKALESSKLKDLFQDLSLEIKGESDLSVGQRQLICLARVLVRSTKIIVFDEATENVDHEMGALMKEIVNNNIQECTVLTVAHKLEFVMDCDKLLLLHDGKIVENGSPSDLLSNKNGMFYRMFKKYNDI